MSNQRITRSKTKNSAETVEEANTSNPFVPRRSIPRDPDFNNFKRTLSLESLTTSFDTTIQFCPSSSPLKNITPLKNNISKIFQNKMAIPVNQTVSLKDAVKIVPEFDGSNISLGQFLEGCSDAKNMVEAGAEGNLVKLIRSKIFDEARQAIVDQTFNTVEELKNFYKAIYIPTRSVQQLIGELGREFQRDGESVISFANRLKEIVKY